MSKRDDCYRAYMSGMPYKEISKNYDVSINTLKSWHRRDGWKRPKKGAPLAPHKGAPFGNRNAKGNRGGHGPPEGSHNALKHGLFSKYLPDDLAEICGVLDGTSALDILWGNIKLMYARIIRAQKYMNGIGMDTRGEEEASFLESQSRAMTTLNRMITDYDELANRSQLTTEEQKLRIERLKNDIKIKGAVIEVKGNIPLADVLKEARQRVIEMGEGHDKSGENDTDTGTGTVHP